MGTKRGLESSFISPTHTFSKRGQVTIFIIAGIIILFAFAGILYFTKSAVKERLTAEGEPVLAEVPGEFAPIKEYTDTCISQIGRRGLRIAGEQGGYLYPDLVGEFSSTNPTDADGIYLEPAKVPYWHYNREQNGANMVRFGSLQPKLRKEEDPEMSLEAQLGRFVDEKLAECLHNYDAFAGQGFRITIASAPETEVRVGESTVNFLLDLEVDAAKGEAQHGFEQFYVKIPLRLKQYYDTAEEIAQVQANHSFLERQALDLLAVYADVNPNQLPPTDAVRFDALPAAYWHEAEVKEKVKGMLASNLPLLRYLGSSNFYRYEYPQDSEAVLDLRDLYQKNYDNMILPLERGRDTEVSFDYFGWEPYFDLNDRGGRIEPSHYPVNWQFLHFAIQHYYSTYDISYPVLVTIRDPAALDGEGYTFTFALESNIRNNQIARPDTVIPAPVAASPRGLECDERKWRTEPIRAVVLDSATFSPLEAVQIGFSIPEQTDCMIGMTDGRGEIESKYPAVYGGVASFMKEEYLTNFYPLDTYNYRQQPGIIGYAVAQYPEPAILLHPYKSVNVSVKKKTLEKCINSNCYFSGSLFSAPEPIYSYWPELLGSRHSWVFVDAAKPLTAEESATIILNRVGDTQAQVYGDEFSTVVAVAGDNKQEIPLVPGVYEVKALLTSGVPVVIPEEERCSDGFITDLTGAGCFTIEETVLEKIVAGQLQWDTATTYLTITPEQLYGSSELTWYILGFNPYAVPEEKHLRVIEDLQVMGQLGNFSQILRPQLEPTFR